MGLGPLSFEMLSVPRRRLNSPVEKLSPVAPQGSAGICSIWQCWHVPALSELLPARTPMVDSKCVTGALASAASMS